MATSLLFKALSNQNSNHDNDQNLKMEPLYDEPKCHEVVRNSSRGRKGNNNNGKGPKKQPQRGLGVEKLERLRMQESLMKMNETCSRVVPLIPTFTSVQDHFNSVPVRYGAPNHVQGVFQCPPQQVLNGNNRSKGVDGTSSGFSGVGFVVPNQVNRVSSYGYGVPLLSPLVGTPLVTSKELSSMPNVHFEPQSFDVYLNKKSRFNEINVKGLHARRDMTFEICPNYNSPDFLGLVPQSAYATNNIDESVEIIAIHRKGNSRVLMEYEFLKGKDDIGTSSKELDLATNIDVAEASPIIAVPYGDPASTYIDLSLKLSH
ncbi:hypothetical protein TanjilG_09986 [Lupinus angustifolius]|uniref:Uncharacterized protein n=1 Tax=Lupinus angustifolius TaxID=3871 RepID=A0A1J7GRX3_LUPAN|nr:PREDICTED: uncharacterized protein LOC109333897 [Lupinus angustifolius]OIV92388.1 hypothetical protein TanjilG_09986 [Lupinus angustifolius]